MAFTLRWVQEAATAYDSLRQHAAGSAGRGISSKATGLFKQVHKCLILLAENPRHPGLRTHEYHSIVNPLRPGEKVFEAYAQNRTPGAYRVFWCYGPGQRETTILAIVPHP